MSTSEQVLAPSGRLPETLSVIETWGFGLTGLPIWLSIVVVMQADLGVQAIFVWIPATLSGIVINYQVKRLAASFSDVAGGTPNYLTRLLSQMPVLGRYGAVGYFLSWISVIAVNAIILTELIAASLEPFGLPCPELELKLGFTLLPFAVALSGARALSILHLCFVLPSIGLLLLFSLQGLSWLAFAPSSPGLLPVEWGSFDLIRWAKWFFFATYATYACETASAFVADSRHPQRTLQILDIASWLSLPIFVGGSWVVARLTTGTEGITYLNLLTAAQPFWGEAAPLIVTFLLAASCLLAEATAVSNCSRIIHQLALDQQLAPVFAMVSRRGVFQPALLFILALALLFLAWGNVEQIIAWGNVGWFLCFVLLHWALSRQSGWLSRLALGLFLLELIILVVGGLAWGGLALLGGLLLPLTVLLLDAMLRRLPVEAMLRGFQPQSKTAKPADSEDFVAFQVIVLIGLLCGAVWIGWEVRAKLAGIFSAEDNQLFLMLMMSVAFLGVAIACWTSLPQVVAISEARQTAEQAQTQLQQQTQQLEAALTQLQQAQLQLVQNEKMSGLGQLVAGIAHEINNPVNFIYGNLSYAVNYTHDLLNLLQLYQQHYPSPAAAIQAEAEATDLEFVREDLPRLLASMKVGAERIQKIVVSLRTFSRMDEAERKAVDLHEGIDSTLVILKHRLKTKSDEADIEIIRDYGELPPIDCYAGQLNQVFMNLISNAIDALEETLAQKPGLIPLITIKTQSEADQVTVSVTDNGRGIPQAIQSRLFDPFFTTKPIGKGTGMGLSISYQIVHDLHRGTLQCQSEPGRGTTFTVKIPIRQ